MEKQRGCFNNKAIPGSPFGVVFWSENRYKFFLTRNGDSSPMDATETIFGRVKKITKRDRRFNEDSYYFMLSAIDYAVSKLKQPRHVNGKELLEAVREFALQQYGPMTLTVLEHWGIHTTEDFGIIVFNMVEEGLLRKTETDSLDDFKGIFELKEAFKGNYN